MEIFTREQTRQWTLAELEAADTLATGQADDLKVQTEIDRIPVSVWLSRMGNSVTVEACIGGKWRIADMYQAA